MSKMTKQGVLDLNSVGKHSQNVRLIPCPVCHGTRKLKEYDEEYHTDIVVKCDQCKDGYVRRYMG